MVTITPLASAVLCCRQIGEQPSLFMLRLLSAIGAVAVLRKFHDVVLEPYWYFFLRPATSFEAYRKDWAVVTGASRGLGAAFAVALAKRGLNMVLIARSGDALKQVAQRCAAHGVQVHILVLDVLQDPELVSSTVRHELDGLAGDVSVLVNNVGGKPPPQMPVNFMPCYCEDLEHCTFESYFKTNVVPAAWMTSLVLQSMVRRDKGYILNVASMNGLQACPYLSPYSAAKAYLCAYTACLANELRGRGSKVRVESVCPGPVATAGIGRAAMPSRGIPEPLDFAERTLSLAGTPMVETPWPRHWWTLQFTGSCSHFVSRPRAEARLYRGMDYAKMLGPPLWLSQQ